ncbi:protein kinase domain-containing protein [Saccharothrix luteola]|uniref:protein kinase domain-containing protein n=1 Tax=Saccharothrix luteola TaxID=2893018 RepID=UPI001E410D9E|nr:protein kinase [Saccharothrix luteola]MCC8249501.1 protein kinase [Saccharothrix luteola]
MANPRGNHLVPLGNGPVATVYAGAGTAYKVFPVALDRRTRVALEREIGKWRRVPFTPVVRGVEELADGVTAVYSELCRYSLAARVRHEGALPVAEVLDLGQVLAEALAAAHAAGLVHGGVTATNVLFRASGEPVLADGGLVARRAFPADPPVDFAAPETVRDAVRDARTDLYGLGAVLYLALTGEVPYPGRMGERAEEHLLRVLGAPVPEVTRADLPVGLADLVRALLAEEPDARPTDVAARLAAIAGVGFDDFADTTYAPTPNPPFTVPTTAPAAPTSSPYAPPPPPSPYAPPAPSPYAPPNHTPPAPPSHTPPAPPLVSPGSTPVPVAPPFAPPLSQVPPAPSAEVPFGPAPSPSPHLPANDAPPETYLAVPPAPPVRMPLAEVKPTGKKADRTGRLGLVAGVVGALALFAAAPFLLLGEDEPPPAPAAPTMNPPDGNGAVQIELEVVEDTGDQVRLAWRSSAKLDYVVIVAPEGQPNRATVQGREQTTQVPVEPGRKYCFEVQGTDRDNVYVSEPKGIRDAVCGR